MDDMEKFKNSYYKTKKEYGDFEKIRRSAHGILDREDRIEYLEKILKSFKDILNIDEKRFKELKDGLEKYCTKNNDPVKRDELKAIYGRIEYIDFLIGFIRSERFQSIM